MNDPTHHICERFQNDRHQINVLVTKDPEFLALCEDYEACVNALQYWSESNEPEAEARVDEYHNLILELEDEIGGVLRSLKPLFFS